LEGELNTNLDEVAIVILNYNGARHLQQYLPSVLKTDYSNLRIIVADNCSTDDSLAVLASEFPQVQIIKLSSNYGFTGGYIRALEEVDSPYLVLMNSDVRVELNWLSEAMNCMRRDEYIAAVQPKILSDQRPTHFEYAGAAGGMIDKWGYPFCRGRLFDELEEDLGQYNESTPIFWASGCALLIKNEVYKNAGGLDPVFFAHLEEIDLCWRIQRMGYAIQYAPKSVVYHLGGGTLSYQNPRKTFLNFRNSLFTIVKNKTGFSAFSNVFIRLVLDGVAVLQFLLKGRFGDFFAILKAHGSFYKHLPKVIRRKSLEKKLIEDALQRQHKDSRGKELPGKYPGSIVFSYFLKGIKKYSDLV